MTIQISRVEYKGLGLIVAFAPLSGAVYCTDTYNGEQWAYGSYDSYYEEMQPLLIRAGLNIKSSNNKGVHNAY